ncbi:DMT family transporter [Thermomicrobiaceae bacterium CFH 74404]|uniref:DMT family transporter n=1 Tax=Thermalbibacter longus TaxID=2951981 RepID=A0AA42BA59_9BACT|nr:DMT family transporter [Thermalbibacter longus]MCM8748139.1 DMT family transporter [Thermalbibacter longus]
MTLFALGLILAAAFCHATWNLLAKRVGSGAPFIWLFGTLGALIYGPLAIGIILWQRPELGLPQLVFIVGSALLHIAYFLLLQQGYRVGDLSLVYPLARGTGPMLSTLGAIALFGERPSPLALAGAALIIGSIFLLTGGARLLRRPLSADGAVVFGLLTGTLIATYTLWDKHAVSALAIPPVVLDWSTAVARSLLLTPIAARRWDEVQALWRDHRLPVLGVAILTPLAYILVLTAMRFTPVSYVAPAREISILIGTAMGAHLLDEGNAHRRLLAASGMVLGIIALALG